MKKLLWMVMLAALAIPAFADDDCDDKDCHKFASRHEMAMKADPAMRAKMQAYKAEHRARKAAFEQKENRLEKLVSQYKKAKAGSKKQANLRAEISQELESVREEQLKMRAERLSDFEKRMGAMKEELAKEQDPAAKQAWIERMTEVIIAEDGDLEDALEREGRIYKGKKTPFKKHFPHRGELPPPPAK